MTPTLIKFADILRAELSIEAGKVTPSSRLAEDLGADSLDLEQIVVSAEVAFDIEIPANLAAEAKTVAGWVLLIDRLREDQSQQTQ